MGMPRGARTKDPFVVSPVDEALSEASGILMKFSEQHMSSGYTSANLADPGCISTKLYAAIDNLIHKQRRAGGVREQPPVSSCIRKFLGWLRANAVDLDDIPLELTEDLPEGCGLITTKDIQVKDKFLTIPQNIIMSTHTADIAGISKIQSEAIQRMPSVKLAVYLLLEKHKKTKSFWKEYIDVLPRSLSLPLFWTTEELLALKGTSVYGTAIQQQVNTLMQYLNIRQALQATRKKDLAAFTYEEFRWAVGIIMSRQNFVPIDGTPQICLIPFWDMLNHDEGVMTTFYNQETASTECHAMRNYKKGEQMFIYYGERANSKLLLYQGFVFSKNKYKSFTFHHKALNENDKFKPAKQVFLSKHDLNPNTLQIQGSDDVLNWSSMVTLRTASATGEELKKQNALEKPEGQELSLANEVAATEQFLAAIESIKAWKQNQYVEIPETADSLHFTFARSLRQEEEEIIAAGVEFLNAYRAKLRKRERRAKQKAKKKAKQETEKILQSACEDLD